MTVSIGDIELAAQRIDSVSVKTPICSSHVLNERLNAHIYIKPENLQHVGAFKFRGAYNRLSQLSSEEKKKGVVAFSSGNHAQGIAFAAKLLGIDATIVMPHDAPEIKKQGTKDFGGNIRFYDRQTESREDIAAEIAQDTGATLVPAFDDINIIAGQGTVGLEAMRQLGEKGIAVDSMLSPAGGGGLLAGVSTAVKALSPRTEVFGVEPDNFHDHYLSKEAGERVKVSGTDATRCDSLMATTPGEITWAINSKNVDDFLVVTEDEVAHAIAFAFRYLKLVIEPGGAVALAAILNNKTSLEGKNVAIILSGGNIDSSTLADCLNQYPNP